MNDNAKMIGGYGSTLTGGHSSTLTGGHGSTLCWEIWDGTFYRLHTFYVGEDGVFPNVAYNFVEGKLEAQTSEENKIGECIGTLPDDGKTDAEVQKEFNDHNDAQNEENKLPKSYFEQTGCKNCKHHFTYIEADDEDRYFCTLNAPPAPRCGSVMMDESFFVDAEGCSTKEDPKKAMRAWGKWANGREVQGFGTCDNWVAQTGEEE